MREEQRLLRQRPIIRSMDYDLYWQARKERVPPPRVYYIAPLLTPGSSVLDVGCGDGELFEYANATVANLDWHGIDVSPAAIEKSRRKGMQCTVSDITSSAFLGDTSVFDYLVISEVLEHIMCPEQVIEHCLKKFRRGLIVTLPNIAYYKHRWRMLTGRFPKQWSWHPSEHIRFWSIPDFDDWLKLRGVASWKMLTTNGFPLENERFPQWHRWWPNLLAEGCIYFIRPEDVRS